MSAADTIKQTVTENDVVLFMKGTKMMPQCGFSSRVAGVLVSPWTLVSNVSLVIVRLQLRVPTIVALVVPAASN